MSYAGYLRELLRPLGVYDLDAPFNGGELEADGQVLDGVEGTLEETRREADLTAAESWGLERLARLFVRRPVAEEPEGLRQALAALLRIGGDSFTLEAINDTLAGCGIPALAEELGVGAVVVSFPMQAGEPKGFEQMKKIIEDILPAHLAVQYWFWYLTWEEMERIHPTWRSIDERRLTWAELEVCMA